MCPQRIFVLLACTPDNSQKRIQISTLETENSALQQSLLVVSSLFNVAEASINKKQVRAVAALVRHFAFLKRLFHLVWIVHHVEVCLKIVHVYP